MQKVLDKKEQIIEAAEAMFHKYGYSKTSLDDIAKEAGIGKGTIYYYYESKEDIFLEVAKYHSEKFYLLLKDRISQVKSFEEKFNLAIRLPIKLLYEHAPLLLDAVKNLPRNYLHKLEQFRKENKQLMVGFLDEIFQEGISQGVIADSLPVHKMGGIVFDWFLMGDSNIIIQYPEEFIKKAEADYEWITQLLLYGIVKRGNS